jgi:hypothetical protein
MKKYLGFLAFLVLLVGCAGAPAKTDEEKAAEERELRGHSQEMNGRIDQAKEEQNEQ